MVPNHQNPWIFPKQPAISSGLCHDFLQDAILRRLDLVLHGGLHGVPHGGRHGDRDEWNGYSWGILGFEWVIIVLINGY